MTITKHPKLNKTTQDKADLLTVKFITTGYLDNNAYQTKLIDTLENLNLTIGLYKLLTDNISIIKTNKAEELNEIIVKIYEYFNIYK